MTIRLNQLSFIPITSFLLIHVKLFNSSRFKLTVWVKIGSIPQSSNNSSKYPRICCRRKASLFQMMGILNARLNFSSASSIKSAFSGLRQFLSIENPLKMMKNSFYFIRLFLLSIHLKFCLVFLFMRKTAWFARYGKFQNLWRHNLGSKQLQYIY